MSVNTLPSGSGNLLITPPLVYLPSWEVETRSFNFQAHIQ